jgi:predicted RNA-binding protein YlqC (UPF0109 family)
MTSDDRERSGSIDGATADREAVLEGGSEDLDDEEEFDDEELDDDDEEEFDDEELDDEELDDEELDDEELDDDDDLDDDDLDDDDLDDEDGEEDEHLGNGVGHMHAGEADYEPGDVNTISGPAARRGEPAAGRGDTAVAVLEYLARSMADDPDAVVIREEDRRGSTILRLHVAPHDMGRVIGRRGRTAQAIRTLVAVAGASDGAQTLVDIADD